jgi:hypothetical protein
MNNLLQILVDKYHDVEILSRFTPHSSIADPVVEDYFGFLNTHFPIDSYIYVSLIKPHMHIKVDVDTLTFINNKFGRTLAGYFVTKKLFNDKTCAPYVMKRDSKGPNRSKYIIGLGRYGKLEIA